MASVRNARLVQISLPGAASQPEGPLTSSLPRGQPLPLPMVHPHLPDLSSLTRTSSRQEGPSPALPPPSRHGDRSSAPPPTAALSTSPLGSGGPQWRGGWPLCPRPSHPQICTTGRVHLRVWGGGEPERVLDLDWEILHTHFPTWACSLTLLNILLSREEKALIISTAREGPEKTNGKGPGHAADQPGGQVVPDTDTGWGHREESSASHVSDI